MCKPSPGPQFWTESKEGELSISLLPDYKHVCPTAPLPHPLAFPLQRTVSPRMNLPPLGCLLLGYFYHSIEKSLLNRQLRSHSEDPEGTMPPLQVANWITGSGHYTGVLETGGWISPLTHQGASVTCHLCSHPNTTDLGPLSSWRSALTVEP